MINYETVPFISCLILVAILSFRMLFLQKKGIRLRSKQRKKKKSSRFLFPFFGLIFLLWLFEITQAAFNFSFSALPKIFTQKLLESSFTGFSGTILIFLSLTALIITLIHFNSSLRFGLDENNKGKLITNGIFSVSRNPFFVSLELYFMGVTLILPNVFLLVFTLAAFAGIHFFILKEERFLTKNYGNEYLKYQQKTRRYF